MRKRSTKWGLPDEVASSEARAERLAALVVAAVEGANRAQPRRAPPGLLLEVAAELEDMMAGCPSPSP